MREKFKRFWDTSNPDLLRLVIIFVLVDEHIRDPHACPLNDLYVNWDVPDPCAARIFLNR